MCAPIRVCMCGCGVCLLWFWLLVSGCDVGFWFVFRVGVLILFVVLSLCERWFLCFVVGVLACVGLCLILCCAFVCACDCVGTRCVCCCLLCDDVALAVGVWWLAIGVFLHVCGWCVCVVYNRVLFRACVDVLYVYVYFGCVYVVGEFVMVVLLLRVCVVLCVVSVCVGLVVSARLLVMFVCRCCAHSIFGLFVVFELFVVVGFRMVLSCLSVLCCVDMCIGLSLFVACCLLWWCLVFGV